MSRLATLRDAETAEERSHAIRALLATPLLAAARDPAAFDLVRRHGAHLREWFDETCGWALHVESRRGFARLAKVRPDPDATRPARRLRSTKAPFDRRRYTLLCLIAAELARPGVMTTIGLLADRVRAATAAEPALDTFDSATRDERAAFVDALKLLEHHGVLAAVDGATDAYLDSGEAKVLFSVDQSRLARLIAAPRAPSAVGDQPDLAALLREPRYGDAPEGGDDVPEAQRNRWLRHSITRRLLDDPVVHVEDLSAEQRAYLATLSGRRVVRDAAIDAGFTLEERAEGLLAIDEDAIATDTRFPDEASHVKHAALLLLDRLTSALPVATADLTAFVEGLLGRFPAWAKAYQSDGGAARLAVEAVDLLCAFGLARRDGDAVLARPAAARYAVPPDEALRVIATAGAPARLAPPPALFSEEAT